MPLKKCPNYNSTTLLNSGKEYSWKLFIRTRAEKRQTPTRPVKYSDHKVNHYMNEIYTLINSISMVGKSNYRRI